MHDTVFTLWHSTHDSTGGAERDVSRTFGVGTMFEEEPDGGMFSKGFHDFYDIDNLYRDGFVHAAHRNGLKIAVNVRVQQMRVFLETDGSYD
mmetsp:Transcript_37684/g.93323  ORF Transcript_37684/g.93323 Transcript_37684/m.93323 type:complete len:92 (+) Transcript_37684:310-585(+)